MPGPHLRAAEAELPLKPQEREMFGPTAAGLLDSLGEAGLPAGAGWFWIQAKGTASMMNL